MKKLLASAAVAATALLVAACGSSTPADAPAEADNVEMPASDVMAQPGMDEDSAVDPAAADVADESAAEPAAAPADSTAADAADAADDAAADLSAAMAED